MDRGLFYILSGFSFALGACIASFLNVVIWRVPRGESIVSPPSHCPKCNAPIRWYQNIPILSWLVLRGKCANCKAPISPRYILVETLGGLLFLAAFWKYGTDGGLASAAQNTLVAWIWIALMIVGSMIDFDHKLLPDFVTVGGMVLGVVFNGMTSIIHHSSFFILHSLIGLAFGFGLLWLIRFFGSKAFKREAMGLGDVFLMGAVGALFGPVAVLVTLILSSVFGSVVGIGMVETSGYTLINKTALFCIALLFFVFVHCDLLMLLRIDINNIISYFAFSVNPCPNIYFCISACSAQKARRLWEAYRSRRLPPRRWWHGSFPRWDRRWQ